MQPTSSAGSSEPIDASAGFVLIDALATLSIIALALGLVFASIPHGTTAPQMAAIAQEIATFLTAARTDAVSSGRVAHVVIDGAHRTITMSGHRLLVPSDVGLSVLSAETCLRVDASVGVVFRPDGSSCGAVIRIARGSSDFRIRVSWYTGSIEILAA